ncbi:MAG: hypothetical protein D6801_06150 [Alphaproteobacteria bacterium]|nr:MAG: hypothetical protein D6801_06150 [Alphaproteobacteria bacterium]
MPNDWMIDVLADLKAFAQANGLTRTAESIDEAMFVALAETARDVSPQMPRPAPVTPVTGGKVTWLVPAGGVS